MNLILGDCLHEMAKLPADSVDMICTDPPYEIGFMGKVVDKLQGNESLGEIVTGAALQLTSKTGEFADGKHGGTQIMKRRALSTGYN